MNELVKYEAARLALAEAKAVDEVKKIHDVSAAMKAYARQAKDRQLEIDASEIRIRAERRLGEMIVAQKETSGLNKGGWHGNQHTGVVPTKNTPNETPPLERAGISRKLSARSQKIAAIPEDKFEQTLAEHRTQQQAVTARTMETLAKQGEEHEQEEQPTKEYRYNYAGQYVDTAICQLRRIKTDDPNARAELARLKEWIAKLESKLP